MSTFERKDLSGLYLGQVESISDPELIGRVKVRVPHVYGPSGVAGSIDTSDLPWAYPAGLPAGGSADSGGISWLPENGDQAYVQFLDGEPEKPVWFWANQTRKQRTALEVHQYTDLSPKVPIRAGFTRYGHTIELNSSSIIVTTKSGYSVVIDDGSQPNQGNISISTPLGQILELNDSSEDISITAIGANATITNDVTAMARSWDLEATTENFKVTAAQEINLTTLQSIYLKFNQSLMMGQSPSEPYVLGLKLVQFMTVLMLWANTHSHGGVQSGAGTTSPPVAPFVPTPTIPDLISKKIFGE